MSEDQDSAEGQARRLENVNTQLAALLRRPVAAERLRAAKPGEWSSAQVLGHLIEVVSYWTNGLQALAVATGEPPRFGRTPDAPERLAAVEHGAHSEPADLAREFDSAATAAAAVIRAMTPAQRARTGIHNSLGEISVANALNKLVVEHAEGHLAQLKLALDPAH